MGRVVPHTFENTDLQFSMVISLVGNEATTWDAMKALYR